MAAALQIKKVNRNELDLDKNQVADLVARRLGGISTAIIDVDFEADDQVDVRVTVASDVLLHLLRAEHPEILPNANVRFNNSGEEEFSVVRVTWEEGGVPSFPPPVQQTRAAATPAPVQQIPVGVSEDEFSLYSSTILNQLNRAGSQKFPLNLIQDTEKGVERDGLNFEAGKYNLVLNHLISVTREMELNGTGAYQRRR